MPSTFYSILQNTNSNAYQIDTKLETILCKKCHSYKRKSYAFTLDLNIIQSIKKKV